MKNKIPIISLFIALILTSFLILFINKDPIEAYFQIIKGSLWGSENIKGFLEKTSTLLLTGLSFSFALKGGMFNIASQGQLVLGGLIATISAIKLQTLFLINPILSLLIGGLAGALIGLLIGYLKVAFEVNEAISSIMFNYIVFNIEAALLNTILKSSYGTGISPMIPKQAYINSPILWLLISFISALLYYYLNKRLQLKNNIKKLNFKAGHLICLMSISAFISGIAGSLRVLSGVANFRYSYGIMGQFGFDGIVIALLGKTTFGIIVTSFLFGALSEGAIKMAIFSEVPAEVITILKAIIILFASANWLIREEEETKNVYNN